MDRAERRSNNEKAKKRTVEYLKHVWFMDDDWVEYYAPRLANNRKSCSCWMCKNPRWSGEKTYQEQKADVAFKEYIKAT